MQRRNDDEYRMLYENFYAKLYRVAFNVTKDRYLSEDVVQETFVKAFRKIDCITDERKIGAWLMTIATRTSIDFIRKEKRTQHVLTEDNFLHSIVSRSEQTVEQEIDRLFFKQELVDEVDLLKPSYRDVFLLKYKDGLKEEEIASVLKLKKGTVKTRLYRARKQLKAELHAQYREYVSGSSA